MLFLKKPFLVISGSYGETATMLFLKKPFLVISGSYGGHRRHTTDD